MAATRTDARAGGALRWWGMALIAVTGVIHLILAPEYGDYAPYLGLLFVANGLGAALALVGIVRHARWGWVIGVLVAGGAAIAYVWSRSVGLPSLPEDDSEWLDPLGLVALMSEGLFVLLAVGVLTGRAPARWILPLSVALLAVVTLRALPVSADALQVHVQ